MDFNEATVYWIRLPSHTDPYTEGYIGVSKYFQSRMNGHLEEIMKRTHPNKLLENATVKYGWDNLIKEEIFFGTEDGCYDVEYKFRPTKRIGWNIAPGGHRGPGWPKGKKRSEEWKKNVAAKRAEYKEKNKDAIEQKRLAKQEEKRLEKELKKQERLLSIQRARELKGKLIEEERLKLKLAKNSKRPMCIECGERPGRSAGKSVDGIRLWRKYCSSCDSAKYRKKREVALTCGECGFGAVDVCQMDLVEGRSLCACCSRLHFKRLKEQEHQQYELTVDSTVDFENIRL